MLYSTACGSQVHSPLLCPMITSSSKPTFSYGLDGSSSFLALLQWPRGRLKWKYMPRWVNQAIEFDVKMKHPHQFLSSQPNGVDWVLFVPIFIVLLQLIVRQQCCLVFFEDPKQYLGARCCRLRSVGECWRFNQTGECAGSSLTHTCRHKTQRVKLWYKYNAII